MKIKVGARRIISNEKWEEWDYEKKEYIKYSNRNEEEEIIKLLCKPYYVIVKGIGQYYSIDKIHRDVNMYPINKFLRSYQGKLTGCKNINDCIEAFKKTIKEEANDK